MANGLIHLERDGQEWFLEWSTVVDAPVTYGMTETELRMYIRQEYGNQGLNGLDKRLGRARKSGHSYLDDGSATIEDFLVCNRAGPNESLLSVEELIDRYCIERRE